MLEFVLFCESMRENATAEKRTIKPRISVQLSTDKSAIDFEGMTPETRDKLRQLLASPEARQQLGVQPPAAGQTEPELPTEALMGPLFDALGLVLVGLARRAGYSEVQARVLLFSADEQQLLCPLASKVLDKYFPDGLGAWKEEIALGVVLGGIAMRKQDLLRASRAPMHANTEENSESATAH